MTDLKPELRDRIKAIIDAMLHDYTLDAFGIAIAEDATGDESIFVDLWYQLSTREFDPALLGSTTSAVHSMLVEYGEMRYPYIRHHLKDGQQVKAA